MWGARAISDTSHSIVDRFIHVKFEGKQWDARPSNKVNLNKCEASCMNDVFIAKDMSYMNALEQSMHLPLEYHTTVNILATVHLPHVHSPALNASLL